MRSARKESTFNRCLHGARGLAALIVVFSHVGAAGITGQYFAEMTTFLVVSKNVLESGQYGVEIFFMISGYLITASILRHRTVASFLVDRCIRLYPVFLPAIALIFFVGPFINHDYFIDVSAGGWVWLFVVNLLFVPGVYPMEAALVVAWSLSYEAVFYLSASYMKWFRSNTAARMFFVGLIVVPLIVILPRSVFFLVGVLIYYAVDGGGEVRFRVPKLFLVNLLGLFGLLFLIQEVPNFGVSYSPWQLYFMWAAAGTLGYLTFIEIVMRSPSAKRLLEGRQMQFLGSISYSLYIWHVMVMFATKRIFAGTVGFLGSFGAFSAFAISSIVLSILVSFVSYQLFEVRVTRKLVEIKRRRMPA